MNTVKAKLRLPTSLNALKILSAVCLFVSQTGAVYAGTPTENLDRALNTTDFLRDTAHDEFAAPRKTNFILPKGKVDQKQIAALTKLLKGPAKVEDGKKDDVWEQIKARRDRTMTGLRGGGGSDRPIGCYFGNFYIHYQSKYKDVPDETVAFWAYDLHRFLFQNRSWCGNFRDSVYMHYADKERFAREWWQALDKTFAALTPAEQAVWIHDALEDGMIIYWFYDTQDQYVGLQRKKAWLGWEIRGIERRD